jgi:hypothetical protein
MGWVGICFDSMAGGLKAVADAWRAPPMSMAVMMVETIVTV